MFNNKRYLTKGILRGIPIEIQMIIWAMIEELKNKIKTVDYLQVFELTTIYDTAGKPEQHIKHFQEQPPHKVEITVKCDVPVKEKIYVIDDETHSTMLLASEY